MAPRARFGIGISPQHVDWPAYRDAARAIDQMGFDTFWTWDHLLPISGDPDGVDHECYTLMAALAEVTRRVRLGALVTGVMYRNPALQIKMATQLDVISGGRLTWGVGAAWAEREFTAYQIPFPEPKVRIRTLRETLDLAKLLWSGDPRKKVTYEGRHVVARDLFLNPQPLQRPHPPIMIGGSGEQLTLRVVARHAEIWHGHGDLDTLKRKIALIHQYAPDYGRRGEEIVKSTTRQIWVGKVPDEVVARRAAALRTSPEAARGVFLAGDPSYIEDQLHRLIEAGVTYFIVNWVWVGEEKNWERISEQIIPRFS